MAASRDFYEILGVSRTANQDEIQRAYRRLARTYHPDINKDPAAEERFKEVSEAYDVLSDPDTRRRYDAFGAGFRQIPDDVDPAAWARAQAGAGAQQAGRPGSRRTAGGVRFDTAAAEEAGLGGIFDELFGRRAGPAWGPIPGADQEAEIELTVEEAYHGGRRSITMSGPDGTRTLTVNIPPGATEGRRIRLRGQGGRGGDGAPPGDLYLIVRIAPHPRYRLEGRDIHIDLPVTPWEAALGATVAIETPAGEAKVKVPPGTSSGRRLRLRGRGLPDPGGEAGHLTAEVRIVLPPKLTRQQRKLFEELGAASTFDPRRRE